jgi:hypothetical protein
VKKIVFLLLVSFYAFSQTGIGTTTPVNKFQIETTTANPSSTGSSTNGNLRISGTGALHVLDFGLSSTSTYSWLQARSKSDYATLYDLAFNPIGGRVGIGTTTLSSTLTVGNAAGTIPGEIYLNPTTTTGEGGQVTLKRSLTGSTVDWTIDQVGTTSANARLRIFSGSTETNGLAILENGNIGIGINAPTSKLYVNGDITANSVAGTSDLRFKTNIRSISSALSKVKSLRGVYFNWNQKAFPEKDFSDKTELGFIAQEVEKVLPEVVSKDKTREEYRSVKYDKVVALLVEAIKEQQGQIEQLKKEVKRLKRTKNR